jgi:hypothetical protein
MLKQTIGKIINYVKRVEVVLFLAVFNKYINHEITEYMFFLSAPAVPQPCNMMPCPGDSEFII